MAASPLFVGNSGTGDYRASMIAKKRSSKKRGQTRFRPSPRWIWVLVSVVMVCIAGFGLLSWAKTPTGQASLLRLGVERYRDDVIIEVERALVKVLPSFLAGPAEVGTTGGDVAVDLRHDWPLADGAPIRCRVVSAPDTLAFHDLQMKLGTELSPLGAEILWAERLVRADRPAAGETGSREMLRLDLGLAGRPTHTLLIHPADTRTPTLTWGSGRERPLRPSDLLGETDQPTVAIIVDDWGNGDTAETRAMLRMNVPLTLSVLPGLRFSRRYALAATELALPETPLARQGGEFENAEQVARRIRLERGCPVEIALSRSAPPRPIRKRREVMLHLPMEPQGYPGVNPGGNPVRVGMSREEIAAIIHQALEGLPGVTGVNNHMGSAATSDRVTMDALAEVLAELDLFFVDSMTTATSTAYDATEAAGIPSLRNRLFLDQAEPSVDGVKSLLRRLVASARATGFAVGICHPYPETVAALTSELSRYEREGIRFVTVSELMALQAESLADSAAGMQP